MLKHDAIRTMHIMTSLERRGAETFAVQVIDRLNRARFSPGIWTTRLPTAESPIVPEHTPVLSAQDRAKAPARTPQVLREFVATLQRVRPHLIQCHGGRALKYAVAAKLFYKAPAYVYTKISSIHPALDSPMKRRLYGLLLEQVDAIVAGGEQVRSEVEHAFHLRRPQILTISNGRDVGPFLKVTPALAAQTRAELGIAPHDVCLLAVGGLVKEKDPEFALRLYADLLPAVPGLRLMFAGSGPLDSELRRQAGRLKVADRVQFLGVRTDVPLLMFAADILILPSLTEGVPGVLIEAGMAGCPAVAFKVGSVVDVLVDGVTGYAVAAGDQTTFRDRVLQLARGPSLRAAMGAAAMRRCRRGFDIEASVAQYESLFLELVEGSLSSARHWPTANPA